MHLSDSVSRHSKHFVAKLKHLFLTGVFIALRAYWLAPIVKFGHSVRPIRVLSFFIIVILEGVIETVLSFFGQTLLRGLILYYFLNRLLSRLGLLRVVPRKKGLIFKVEVLRIEDAFAGGTLAAYV